jgi:hypothetical protein
MFTIGVAPDGELHMNRQVAAVRRVWADGVTQVVEEIADINPGAKTDRPQPREKRIEISRHGADGQFDVTDTRTVQMQNSRHNPATLRRAFRRSLPEIVGRHR